MTVDSRALRAWSISSGSAGIIVLFGVLLFQTPASRLAVTKAPSLGMTVGMIRLDSKEQGSLLKEEATMRDPTPLFLPTRWNAGDDALPADFRREFGTSFEGYAPKLAYTGEGLKLSLPAPIAVPTRPADAFASDKPTRPFQGLGQKDENPPSVANRGAFVRVTAAANGQSVIAEPLQDANPPNDVFWQPLEFLIAVDRTGVVRPPVLTESSRVSAVDSYFVEYLVNRLHIGERLTPGFYRISFGP